MSFYGVTDLWTYVIGAIGIILLPGPNSLYVLSVARGVRAGYQPFRRLCRRYRAVSVHCPRGPPAAAHPSRCSWWSSIPVRPTSLGWDQSVVLGAIKNGVVPRCPSCLPKPPCSKLPPICSSRFGALVISLLNFKAILFLLSFFVQFIDPTYARPIVPFLILGSIIMAFSALYLSVLIYAEHDTEFWPPQAAVRGRQRRGRFQHVVRCQVGHRESRADPAPN